MIEVRTGDVECSGTGGEITFGRSSLCTIKLDTARTDTQLSRIAGAFRHEADRWQLYNESGRLDLAVDIDGGIRSVVEPGAWPLVLPPGSTGRICIQTTRRYDVDFTVAPDPEARAEVQEGLVPGTDEPTTEDMATALKLNEAERAMLAAICEPRLCDPSARTWTIPPTSAVCGRLGIDAKRAEDLVDGLAGKFSIVLPGLIGDNRSRATSRRQRLAEFALLTRCVTAADLRRLPPPKRP